VKFALRKTDADPGHQIYVLPLLVNTWLPYIKTGLAIGLTGLIFNPENKSGRTKAFRENAEMKTYYQITAEGIGIVLLRKRKIAKALRRWLRENGLSYEYNFYIQ